ncbi:MAG: hypothetical protein ACLQQ4_12090 [Bacteroidia bacterium]
MIGKCNTDVVKSLFNRFVGLALVITFLFPACKPATRSKKRSERELVVMNKIKTIKEYETPMRLGVVGAEHLRREKQFNAQGLFLKEIFYNDSGVQNCTAHEYDKNDNQVKSLKVLANGVFQSRYTRAFDEKNNVREIIFTEEENGPYIYRNEIKYDNGGRKIETDWFSPAGPVIKTEKFKYDDGKLIEDDVYDPQGQLELRETDKYDSAENLIEDVQYYPNNTIDKKTTLEYNKDTDLVKKTIFSGSQVQYMATYEYNNKHLLTSRTEYSPAGDTLSKWRYEYEFFPGQ